MNRDQFIKTVKAFRAAHGLRVQDVIVFSGGSMIMRGWREETRDLDCLVGEGVFEKLVAQGNPTREMRLGKAVEVVEFFVEASAAPSGQDFDVIDGVAVQTVPDLIRLKQRLNRPKDRADLEVIFKNSPIRS